MPGSFPSALDKPIVGPKTDVPLSTFAFLYSEIIQYYHRSAASIQDMENR